MRSHRLPDERPPPPGASADHRDGITDERRAREIVRTSSAAAVWPRWSKSTTRKESASASAVGNNSRELPARP